MIEYLLLGFGGFSYGLLAAAGVFTVLAAVGLIPRFAGKTHSGRDVILYEEMVIAGTIVGGVASVFGDTWETGKLLDALPKWADFIWLSGGKLFLGVLGLFCGMFVGCLALAVAEMLDSIPIFTRRIHLKRGIGLAILAMAAGKVTGSLLYFVRELYHTVE